MHWVSLGIIVVFGGATLLLHDETFIKWKPTVLYWAFALILLVGRIGFDRNLIAALIPDLTLPDAVWGRVTWAWIAFLAAMGAANLYIASRFPTDIWVNFKIWGGIGMFMLAAIATVASVARYLPEKP
jgi:intracellular septation protein